MNLEKITKREELSKQLKYERLRFNISKKEFSSISKLSISTIYRIERGNFNYTIQHFLKYINTLHVLKHTK